MSSSLTRLSDLFVYFFLLERKPNIVMNIRPGANHHGPEDLELILEEVNEFSWNCKGLKRISIFILYVFFFCLFFF